MIVEKKKNKAPITQEKIFKFMFFITIVVSAIFLLKNLLGGAMQEAIMIGSTVAVFGLVFLVLHLRKAKETTKQLVLAISLMVLIFVIALNSGDYYSDDFIMFLGGYRAYRLIFRAKVFDCTVNSGDDFSYRNVCYKSK